MKLTTITSLMMVISFSVYVKKYVRYACLQWHKHSFYQPIYAQWKLHRRFVFFSLFSLRGKRKQLFRMNKLAELSLLNESNITSRSIQRTSTSTASFIFCIYFFVSCFSLNSTIDLHLFVLHSTRSDSSFSNKKCNAIRYT